MARKTYSGADLKAFYDAPEVWGSDAANPLYYVDDDTYLIDGEELGYEQAVEKYGAEFTNLSDASKVSISSGVLIWQGDGSRKDHLDLAQQFASWHKKNSRLNLVATFSLPKTDQASLQAIIEAVEKLGGKITSGLPAAPKADEPKTKAPKPR